MIRDQLYLFDEHNPFNTIVKNVDYVDLHTLPYDPQRKKYSPTDLQYNALPKGKYFLFKTGGINYSYKERGKIFPYIQNQESGKILSVAPTRTDLYPKITLHIINRKEKNILARMHRLIGLAFLENKNLYNGQEWVVGHKDDDVFNYHIDNLMWVTQQQNSRGTTKEKSINTQKSLQKLKEFYGDEN